MVADSVVTARFIATRSLSVILGSTKSPYVMTLMEFDERYKDAVPSGCIHHFLCMSVVIASSFLQYNTNCAVHVVGNCRYR